MPSDRLCEPLSVAPGSGTKIHSMCPKHNHTLCPLPIGHFHRTAHRPGPAQLLRAEAQAALLPAWVSPQPLPCGVYSLHSAVSQGVHSLGQIFTLLRPQCLICSRLLLPHHGWVRQWGRLGSAHSSCLRGTQPHLALAFQCMACPHLILVASPFQSPGCGQGAGLCPQ